MKRRWLRILLTTLVLLLIAGFGAFSTFLFNPFESGFEYDLSTLVPREVDFYLSKADLNEDFDPFPVPAFFDELERDSSGAVWISMAEAAAREGDGNMARLLSELPKRVQELQGTLAQLPIQIDVLKVFGGKDAATAGFLKSGDVAGSDWAVYGHANWMGKLGVELLRYPGLLGMANRGIEVEASEGYVRLSGGQLPQPVYVTRVLDVVVASSNEGLARQARELEGTRGENSFGQSAKYADYIGLLEREGDEVEAFVDYGKLADALRLPSEWPNAYAEEMGVALSGRFFQLSFLQDLMGILSFGKGLSLRMTGLISTETMNAVQKRFYRQRGFDKARALRAAWLVPADVGLFAYLHGDVGDILREALACARETEVELLDEQARNVWGYSGATDLIDDLDVAFKDRAALMLRPNDYPDEGDAGPPHNDVPVVAWALVLWTDDAEKRDQLQQQITNRAADFSIKGREPGSPGVFENSVKGGYKVREYWSELVDGTGHIATLILDDYFVISNNNLMLGDVVKTYLNINNASDYPRLSEEGYFQTLVNTGLASSNLLLWLNPRSMSGTLRDLEAHSARESVVLDWDVERPGIERQVMVDSFDSRRFDSLSEEERGEFDILYQEAAERRKADQRAREIPRLIADAQMRIKAYELASALLVQVGVDQKRFDLAARIVVPFDGDEQQAGDGAP